MSRGLLTSGQLPRRTLSGKREFQNFRQRDFFRRAVCRNADADLVLRHIQTKRAVQPIAGGPPVRLTDFKDGEQIFDFDWSRDGKQLALVRGTSSSDVVMINNFR